MIGLILTSLALWFAILLLPWQPWRVRESLDVEDVAIKRQTQPLDLTVIIPARNEADIIQETLNSIAHQAPGLRIILVDDESSDQTIAKAESLSFSNLRIIHGEALPEGWSGKLWALEQGFRYADTELILLLDADILLKPGLIPTLVNKLEREKKDFISLMAQLRMETAIEKLLMPAFIYFFKLLYPFKLSNQGHPWVAAAAGGCILMKSNVLKTIGGFESLRSALIDDCTLAAKFRELGKSTWIGLTHSAISLRRYDRLDEIWNMIARTAYTQLRYSPLLLLLCTLLMLLAYCVPLVGLFYAPFLALVTLTIMTATYLPIIWYYRLHPIWALGLPCAGFLFLMMTWSSALRYYRGERSRWKGRTYTQQTSD